MKKTKIKYEDIDYDVKIEVKDQNNINLTFINDDLLKYTGNLRLNDIYEKMPAFDGYSMDEFFGVIIDLKDENFNLIKDGDKIKLDIKIKVLKKEKHLYIDINENKETKDDIIQNLVEQLSLKKNKREELESELNKLRKGMKSKENKEKKEAEKNNFFLNFHFYDFNLNNKNEIFTLYDYKGQNEISTIIVLKDGNVAVGQSLGNSAEIKSYPTGINIFDGENFKELLFIKGLGPEFIELNNKNLLVLENKKKVHIIKLEARSFITLQTFELENEILSELLELSNGVLSFCVKNKKIIFYKNEKNNYSFDYSIQLSNNSGMLLEGNQNEIIYERKKGGYYEGYDEIIEILFYNYPSKQEFTLKISKNKNNKFEFAKKISKDYILISFDNQLVLIDYQKRKLFRTFDHRCIYTSLYNLNSKAFITSLKLSEKKNEVQIIKFILDDNGYLISDGCLDNLKKGISKMAILKNGQLIYATSNGNSLMAFKN